MHFSEPVSYDQVHLISLGYSHYESQLQSALAPSSRGLRQLFGLFSNAFDIPP
jgi:hypothetical protein